MSSAEDACLIVGLNAVIIAVTDEQPRVLTVSLPVDMPIEGGGRMGQARESSVEALPTGPLDPTGDRTLELAVRRWVHTYAGIDLGYVEQLYTFGDRFRDPRESEGGSRVVSVAYIALVREGMPAGGLAARWRNIYHFLPWEDWRSGRPRIISSQITPALKLWIEAAESRQDRELRRERSTVSFGHESASWDGDRVLDRYEILFEMGRVAEAQRAGGQRPDVPRSGGEMAFDHRRILATALGRIRAKIRYRPVIFELVPETFTLLQLQQCVETLSGVRLHKQNFRRLVEHGGLVEGTGRRQQMTGGRPAELFRYRREVVLERLAPGVGLPGAQR